MHSKTALHTSNISDVTKQDNPLAYGEYLAERLSAEKITKTELAKSESVHRAEVYRYLKMASWNEEIKCLIKRNRDVLTNTDIIKAANSSGKDQQKVLDFLNMSIEKRSPDLKLVKESICDTECNIESAPSVDGKCNGIFEDEIEVHTADVTFNNTDLGKWRAGFVTFVTNPLVLIVTLLIAALTALLVSMQAETYSSENVSNGFLIAIACESLLVVFSGLVSIEKKWLSKICIYLIIAGLFVYNLGVMSFEILNSSEDDISLLVKSDIQLNRLTKKRESLEKTLASYQSSGAIGWINKTNKQIEEVDKKISLAEKNTKSSMSIKLLKFKSWGLVFLRFLMMISVVMLTHFLIVQVSFRGKSPEPS